MNNEFDLQLDNARKLCKYIEKVREGVNNDNRVFELMTSIIMAFNYSDNVEILIKSIIEHG